MNVFNVLNCVFALYAYEIYIFSILCFMSFQLEAMESQFNWNLFPWKLSVPMITYSSMMEIPTVAH